MPGAYETSEAIVAGIQAGDGAAEIALVKKYGRSLLYLLEKRTGDREKARDLQQETLIVVLKKLRSDTLKEPGKLSAYLHNTAINLHIGEMRKDIRRNTTADSDLLDSIAITDQDQYLALIKERAREAVRRVIDALENDRDRLILTLYYIEENDKQLICSQLDLSHRHFDRVISRARSRFRSLMEDQQDEVPLETMT